MFGRIVIACYRPKPGKEADLLELARTHQPRLAELKLATDREPVLAVARDGTVVEVFEWRSQAAIAAAHEHPEVRAMWAEFAKVCDYLPVGQLAEAAELFSELTPLQAEETWEDLGAGGIFDDEED